MKKLLINLLFISVLCSLCGCSNYFFNTGQNINTLSDYVSSDGTINIYVYGESEILYTEESSWIDYIKYYSDSKHLIMCANNHEYIHSNVPKSLWEDFKNSESYGSFYNEHLKNNKEYWVIGYDGSNGDDIIIHYH